MWSFFAIFAHDGFLSFQGMKSYLQVSSEIGILAVGVALLMIAGEFDLSIGSLIGFSSMSIALLSIETSMTMPLAALITLILTLFVGYCNGIVVVKSGLPSFHHHIRVFIYCQGAYNRYFKNNYRKNSDWRN